MYSELIEALQIFLKYGDGFLEAGHDVIWAGPDITEVSEEDVKRLSDLGWHWGEYDSFEKFV